MRIPTWKWESGMPDVASGHREARRRGVSCSLYLFLVLACSITASAGESTNRPAKAERYLSYTNHVDPEVPWSIHIVKIDRSHPGLRFCTTMGGGGILGMGNVTDQLKALPQELGVPLAAINGDFYEKAKDYPGRPRDLQIRQGEVVSHPTGHSCFWVDAGGQPHMTNVISGFRVAWPDGRATPLSLNARRTNDAAVLYTAAIGNATRTKGGVEYVLERTNNGLWLPLRVGQVYEARVRAVQTTGNSALDRESMVLSIGPELVPRVPALQPGATLRIIMETIPDLSGTEIAIGGGPALIRDEKVETMERKAWLHFRHPRTAMGWNRTHFFLVEVDGRQSDLSVGMTLQELAEYMLKLGCEQAMNLDGGGSATLWTLGSVRNSPSEGQERPAPNALVIVRKTSQQAAQ